MTAVAFATLILPDTIMLAACLVLTLAVLTFVFWIEPDPGDSAPHRSQLDQLMEAGIPSTKICATSSLRTAPENMRNRITSR